MPEAELSKRDRDWLNQPFSSIDFKNLSLSEEDGTDWLINLNGEIGEWIKSGSDGGWIFRTSDYSYRTKRQLTENELIKVVEIARKYKLPVSMSRGQFDLLVAIYSHPVYLGTDVERIFFFRSDQFPSISTDYTILKQEICEFFWPYIIDPRNIDMLKRYGLPPPPEKPYY